MVNAASRGHIDSSRDEGGALPLDFEAKTQTTDLPKQKKTRGKGTYSLSMGNGVEK